MLLEENWFLTLGYYFTLFKSKECEELFGDVMALNQ